MVITVVTLAVIAALTAPEHRCSAVNVIVIRDRDPWSIVTSIDILLCIMHCAWKQTCIRIAWYYKWISEENENITDRDSIQAQFCRVWHRDRSRPIVKVVSQGLAWGMFDTLVICSDIEIMWQGFAYCDIVPIRITLLKYVVFAQCLQLLYINISDVLSGGTISIVRSLAVWDQCCSRARCDVLAFMDNI